MGKLDGKVAVITGGARGQGASHARTLASQGATIVIGDACRSFSHVPYRGSGPDDLAKTVEAVEELDQRCVGLEVDVSTANGAAALVDAAINEFGKIDILVVNHGIFAGGVPTWELDEAEWDEQINVNLKGVWLTCKQAVPHMIEAGSGSVICTASMAGLKGFTGFTHYVAAKHGVIGVVRALANEVAQFGIRVNAICPTAVNTDMMNNQWAYSLFAGGDPAATREQMLQGTAGMNALPVPLVEPEDISNMVLFLASDESRYITGLVHPVDAGAYNKFP